MGHEVFERVPRAVERDPRLRRRLLRQFDRGVLLLRDPLAARLPGEDLDALVAEARGAYDAIIGRLPWIGGAANPRSFNLYGSALWLALWRTLRPKGLTLEEARPLFGEIFRLYWGRYPRFVWRLFARARMSPRSRRRLQRLALLSQQRTNPADYVYRFVPGEPGRFDFGIDFEECAILKFLRAEGAEELVPVLCELDWVQADLMGIRLERTTTLARGGDRCDFRFSRRSAGDAG